MFSRMYFVFTKAIRWACTEVARNNAWTNTMSGRVSFMEKPSKLGDPAYSSPRSMPIVKWNWPRAMLGEVGTSSRRQP